LGTEEYGRAPTKSNEICLFKTDSTELFKTMVYALMVMKTVDFLYYRANLALILQVSMILACQAL
jgi:hypothetical protein